MQKNALSDQNISDKIAKGISIDNAEWLLDEILSRGNTDNGILLLFSYIKELSGLKCVDSIVCKIIDGIKDWGNCSVVCVSLLEMLNKRKGSRRDEAARLRVLDMIKNCGVSVKTLIEMLSKAEGGDVVGDIVSMDEKYMDEIMRVGLKMCDATVARNFVSILGRMPMWYFCKDRVFYELLNSEFPLVRSGFLDIIEGLVEYNKERKNLETIRELTLLIDERICDVNFYVRSKALKVIHGLFRKESVLKSERNRIIRRIVERVRDRTVLVRKTAIGILAEILLNHPFKNKVDLSVGEETKYSQESHIENKNNITDSNGYNNITDSNGYNNITDSNGYNNITDSNGYNNITDSNGYNNITDSNGYNNITDSNGYNNITDSNRDNNITDSNGDNANGNIIYESINEDYKEFVEIMSNSLKTITLLLREGVKTDFTEILLFIKYAYIMKLQGYQLAVRELLRLVYAPECKAIVIFFQELLNNKISIIYEFIDSPEFLDIIGELSLNYNKIKKDFFCINPYESSFVLRSMRNSLSEEDGLALITHATSILFGSQDEAELKKNITVYCNIIATLRRLRNRIESGDTILRTITRNVVKMIFYERSVVKETVRLIYKISLSPDKTVGKLLKSICLSKSLMKLIDAIGWVALNEYYLLDRLENTYKSLKVFKSDKIEEGRVSKENSIDTNIHKNSGNVPNSINAIKNISEIDSCIQDNYEYQEFRKTVGISELREKRKSIEDGKRLSMGSKMSLKFVELSKQMDNKTEEEISDFFFYLKEKDVLYSQRSMLNQFLPILHEAISTGSDALRVVAYNTLFKLMAVSSYFFNENRKTLDYAIAHETPVIRNNAVVALHDLFVLYNAAFDATILFDLLGSPEIRKTACLVIFSLIEKNVLRIKNNSVKLVTHLNDSKIGIIVKTIIARIAKNKNIFSSVFYEVFTSQLSLEILSHLCDLVDKKIHEPLFLKCLKTDVDITRIKKVFDKFDLSETFITENICKDKLTKIKS